jgi:hypothetical protein
VLPDESTHTLELVPCCDGTFELLMQVVVPGPEIRILT